MLGQERQTKQSIVAAFLWAIIIWLSFPITNACICCVLRVRNLENNIGYVCLAADVVNVVASNAEASRTAAGA